MYVWCVLIFITWFFLGGSLKRKFSTVFTTVKNIWSRLLNHKQIIKINFYYDSSFSRKQDLIEKNINLVNALKYFQTTIIFTLVNIFRNILLLHTLTVITFMLRVRPYAKIPFQFMRHIKNIRLKCRNTLCDCTLYILFVASRWQLLFIKLLPEHIKNTIFILNKHIIHVAHLRQDRGTYGFFKNGLRCLIRI